MPPASACRAASAWIRSRPIITPVIPKHAWAAGDAVSCSSIPRAKRFPATPGVIPDLKFDNVREHSLQWIWGESQAFQQFRGESWMQEPCRTCDRRIEDFGGCRCQALLLTGEA